MPTLDATVGGASANSYISVADADTYFDERLNVSNWTGASADNKARALIMATTRIDQEKFEGEKSTTGQALKFPRIDAYDDDAEEFPSDAIPQIVKDATCEMALRLLNDGTTDALADTGLEEYERIKVGSIEVTTRAGFDAGQLPDNVRRLLREVLITTKYSAELVRG